MIRKIKYMMWMILVTLSLNANDLKKHQINCDNNLSLSCRELAYFSLEENKDYDEAEKYFLKACKLKDAKSCRLLGYIYRNKHTKKTDTKKKFDFFKKACQLDHPNACTALGHLYYQRKNLIEATKSYKKSCILGDLSGCKALGIQYLGGHGIERNMRKSVEILKANCKVNGEGCSLYIGLVSHKIRYKELNPYTYKMLIKSCDLNISNSCNDLGFLSLEVYQDYNKSEKYFQKACQLQNQESCKMIGLLNDNNFINKKNLKKSFYYFNKACKLNNKYACHYAGSMYLEGKGIKKDIEKATVLYQKACNLHDILSCTFLGDYYRLGQGIKVDKVKAVQLYKEACDNGGHLACMKYIGFSVGMK